MNESEKVYQENLSEFKFQSIKKLFIPAILIYLGISFVDSGATKGEISVLNFLALRFVFTIPYLVIYFFRDKLNKKYSDYYGLTIFYSYSLGISIVSYLLGGASSTYYFGIIIVSFTQFLAVPLSRNKTIFYELSVFITYFGINVLLFDVDTDLVGKQISNYLSYALIKILVAKRFKDQMINGYKNKILQQKLEEKENLQSILGELCHLLNNPLFITESNLKKALKKQGDEKDKVINKCLDSTQRIRLVADELMKIQQGKVVSFKNAESVKKYLADKKFDYTSKKEKL